MEKLKPMLLEEVVGKNVYIETVKRGHVWNVMMPACPWNSVEIRVCDDFSEGLYRVTLGRELYGKKWRCWSRKPTDEERSAAEWET